VPSVADLVRRARDPRTPTREQHEAFTKLVERFEQMAFATALPASDDLESARDACQEAFLVAWRTLASLREPAAFGGWIKRVVRTQCARTRRRHDASARLAQSTWDASSPSGTRGAARFVGSVSDPAELARRRETHRSIRRAVEGLPAEERDAITRFYVLGEPLRTVARALEMSVGQAGKSLYTARLRLRRCLPRDVVQAFLSAAPTPAFARRVQAGVLDEFVGEYRFANRRDRAVTIRREGRVLACYAGGQRNVLASRGPDALSPTEFDGEGRFLRDRAGRISRFVYYEFGRRLGVANKVR
jgi:RNA polymerase sigma-70 factor (ECF subfamily)